MTSELPDDSVINLEKETIILDVCNSDDENINVTMDSQALPPAKKMKKEKTPKGGEKRRAPLVSDLTSLDQMTTGFTGFMKNMSNHLATIAKAMSTTQERELEVVDQKKRLLTEIASLPGISQPEVIRAASLFASNPSQMDLFFSSPNDDWKKEVVLDLLSRHE